MIKYYFITNKVSFEGLAMERLEQEWEAYPVLHVDFSLTKYTELRDLTGQLLYIATRFPLNLSDTSFFKFGRFKERNNLTDTETSLEKDFSHFLIGS
nr:AAA family ATPase [uncultured Bacteroides sp.]